MKYLIVIFFLCSVPVLPQSEHIFFNYRTEERPFLYYYSLWNQFDSSVVMYEFGEVHFINGTIRQNAVLSTLVPQRNLQGTNAQGISTDLEAMARTENFTIPGEGDIRWFGQLQSFQVPCNGLAKRDEPNKPRPNWGIVDQTEFVIQLVEAGSNMVLATLDSVGVRPTGAVPPVVDTRYGTNVERVKHSAVIPASYTGKQVYVRISPRRYGPTPYGLSITRYKSWFNLTAEWDSTGTVQIPLSATDSLRDVWFTGLIAYCDSVKAETGWLPDLHGISFAKKSGLAFYHDRYFNVQVDAHGDSSWVEKHTQPLGKRSRNTQITGAVDRAPIASIASIAPNPIAGENAELLLLVGFDMGYRLELISTDGQRLGTIWSGSLNIGRAKLTVPIPKNLPNGSYVLLLEQATGERVHQKTLVIAR